MKRIDKFSYYACVYMSAFTLLIVCIIGLVMLGDMNIKHFFLNGQFDLIKIIFFIFSFSGLLSLLGLFFQTKNDNLNSKIVFLLIIGILTEIFCIVLFILLFFSSEDYFFDLRRYNSSYPIYYYVTAQFIIAPSFLIIETLRIFYVSWKDKARK